ncbi:response regulator transcription factor [Dyadobacter sp. 32]|uniref:response regulator n=1 Tax=Dyadobacter sp. 32 TaxID=538966 RepID=UPI0011ECDE29
MKNNLQILIVEDHKIVASALESIITDHFSNAAVQIAYSLPSALVLLETKKLMDLVILDIGVPGGGSYGMIATLRSKQPGVRILVFTGQDEERYALRFLSAGANGFIPKSSAKEEIGLAIRTVLNNKRYVTPVVQDLITNSYFTKLNLETIAPNNPLSQREREVMELLLQGKWTKEIATELNLKLTTVSTHKSRIFEKLQVTNVIDLFKKIKPD